VRDPRDPRDPGVRTPPDSGWARPEDYDVTEYRETGYGSDRYPPRDGGDPDSGGTLYRGGAQHDGGQESPADQDDDSAYDPTASIRGRVWRPTRGPRAEGAGNPGYGAPERGWRTSDGGYRSTEGGWRAPYRPYDSGEWRHDQRADGGPANTGEIAPHPAGAGEIMRYTPPVTGQPPAYWAGAPDVAGHRQRAAEPPHTGEIVRYQDSAGEPPGYPAPGRGYSGSSGEIVPYRTGATEPARHPGSAADAGRRQRRSGETGETARYPGAASPYSTGETARYGAPPDVRGAQVPGQPAGQSAGRGRFDTDGRGRFDTDGRGRRADGGQPAPVAGRIPGAVDDPAGRPSPARRPAKTGETGGFPRQRPTSPVGYPPPTPQRRAQENGARRDDSPELYSYDPLTLGGGESPAMRYDQATQSYLYDAAPAEPPVPPSEVHDARRAPRSPAGPRGADPRASNPRAADPRASRGIEAGQYDRRGPNAPAPTGPGLNGPDGGVYGGPRYQREPAPGPRQDIPARRPAERGQEQPPVRGAPARPQQRFEGTYPPRSVRNPRNVVPPQGRPRLGSDEDEEDAPGFLHTALVTTAWYTIPLLLYTMYVLTLDGSAQAGDGQSPRDNALNGLLGGMPRVGVALVTSLAVALLIRLISKGWRAATIGFASAVVGAGGATVIFNALTG
jgi:hypothetical protein